MTWFREYLKSNKQRPDEDFNEVDETWFIFALVLLRQGYYGAIAESIWKGVMQSLRDRGADDPLSELPPTKSMRANIEFVTTFLCFFVAKPTVYLKEINEFKSYFIPGFASDETKQMQLFGLVQPSFADLSLEKMKWQSVEQFFKAEWLYATAS